jgi:hypothetical protein
VVQLREFPEDVVARHCEALDKQSEANPLESVFVSLLKAGVTIPTGLASINLPANDNYPDSIPRSVFVSPALRGT